MKKIARILCLLSALVVLTGCYPSAVSEHDIDAEPQYPQLSSAWQFLSQTSAADPRIGVSDEEKIFRGGEIAIRRIDQGYELEFNTNQNGKSRRERLPLKLISFSNNKNFLISVYSIVDNKGSRHFYYNFLHLKGQDVDLIPFDETALNLWEPEGGMLEIAKAVSLKAVKDGIRGSVDLRWAMLAAENMPLEFRTTYKLVDKRPFQGSQEGVESETNKTTPGSQSDSNWHLGVEKDVITGKSTRYANLRPESMSPTSNMLIQLRCHRKSLQVLILNQNVPFKDFAPKGEVDIALVETRWDDLEVIRMIWPISQDYPDQIMDPFGMGGLFQWMMPLMGLGDAKFDWDPIWLLNKLAQSESLTLRTYDYRGQPYVANFFPKVAVREIVEHLPDCLKIN